MAEHPDLGRVLRREAERHVPDRDAIRTRVARRRGEPARSRWAFLALRPVAAAASVVATLVVGVAGVRLIGDRPPAATSVSSAPDLSSDGSSPGVPSASSDARSWSESPGSGPSSASGGLSPSAGPGGLSSSAGSGGVSSSAGSGGLSSPAGPGGVLSSPASGDPAGGAPDAASTTSPQRPPAAGGAAPRWTPAAGFLSSVATADPHSNATWTQGNLVLTTTETITELDVLVSVARTSGVAPAGQWSSVPSEMLATTVTEETDALLYRFTLHDGRTLAPGDYTFAAQFVHTAGKRDPRADTYGAIAGAGPAKAEISGAFR
ncbi:hypothetical protein [Actinoplanes sp. DH11]|uniref:hypothetical protein n=1 Tax=Actinoplanes sp. DH11 TaxID=2857011 RepID=UPI001E3AA5DB|nr:hypothetical protein [Actinoplanes sp. DH11]